MISNFKIENLQEIMNIWLQSNTQAHDFIPESYWIGMVPVVKEMLPSANIYVYYHDDKIVGFIGLNDSHIEGIFIDPKYQSHGFGKQLLDYAKEISSTLTLNVYDKNMRAKSFYLRENFKIIEESIDSGTNEKELLMKWSQN
ncbi:MAG: GNAT family N-acetyltransferase [Erysipelothrix sp.]